jgi:type IV pilus assembly protein PilV
MPGRHQSGLSLIEVLITVVLVSIGLLGLAGLQLTSVRNSSSSGERFIATTLAQDILERMRANRAVAIAGGANGYDLAMGAEPAAAGVAGTDLDTWTDALAAALPQGEGSVEVDANDVATVVVQWAEAEDIDADENQFMSLTLSTTL